MRPHVLFRAYNLITFIIFDVMYSLYNNNVLKVSNHV